MPSKSQVAGELDFEVVAVDADPAGVQLGFAVGAVGADQDVRGPGHRLEDHRERNGQRLGDQVTAAQQDDQEQEGQRGSGVSIRWRSRPSRAAADFVGERREVTRWCGASEHPRPRAPAHDTVYGVAPPRRMYVYAVVRAPCERRAFRHTKTSHF
jgi:hypothetical protein